eukprot:2842020-Pleurochrysis_carterae.AAC.7
MRQGRRVDAARTSELKETCICDCSARPLRRSQTTCADARIVSRDSAATAPASYRLCTANVSGKRVFCPASVQCQLKGRLGTRALDGHAAPSLPLSAGAREVREAARERTRAWANARAQLRERVRGSADA